MGKIKVVHMSVDDFLRKKTPARIYHLHRCIYIDDTEIRPSIIYVCKDGVVVVKGDKYLVCRSEIAVRIIKQYKRIDLMAFVEDLPKVMRGE